MSPSERTIDEEQEIGWIEGLKRNDRQVIAEIYDVYGGLAYGLAARLLTVDAEAEDVVQESFLALWRQAERLDPKRGLRSYLLTIVHHKAIDRLRRRGRRAERNIELEPELVSEALAPEDAAERLSDREVLRAALAALPGEQRQTVEMTYFRGLSVDEVARRMSVPMGTVKSRLRLALVRLRRSFEAAT